MCDGDDDLFLNEVFCVVVFVYFDKKWYVIGEFYVFVFKFKFIVYQIRFMLDMGLVWVVVRVVLKVLILVEVLLGVILLCSY